jgi:hypothetical protein
MENVTKNAAHRSVIAATAVAGVTGIILVAYVLVAAALADAVAEGQTTDLVTLIFPHFFEHSFTYAVVVALACSTYEICRLLTK